MLRDLILLGIGAVFGLGTALAAMAAPLYFPNAPPWVWHWMFWTGIALMVLMITDGAILFFFGRTFHLGPAALANICLFGLAIALIWQTASPAKQTPSNIAVGCRSEVLPKTFGPNESVRVLSLFPTPVENGGGGLAYISNTSGKEWQWKTNDGPFAGEATRCEITNYGNVPVFDFKMFLDLIFIEAVDVPEQTNAKKQGKIKLRRNWIIDAQKIDIGPSNSFVFWIYNQSPNLFVNVLLPRTATLTKLGESKQIEANLTVPQIGGEIPLFFGPRCHFDAPANSPK